MSIALSANQQVSSQSVQFGRQATKAEVATFEKLYADNHHAYGKGMFLPGACSVYKKTPEFPKLLEKPLNWLYARLILMPELQADRKRQLAAQNNKISKDSFPHEFVFFIKYEGDNIQAFIDSVEKKEGKAINQLKQHDKSTITLTLKVQKGRKILLYVSSEGVVSPEMTL